MKQFTWFLSAALVLSAMLLGCGKKSNVDTGRLESTFKSADAAAQSDADKAVSAIKAGNYSEALGDLQKLANKAKLTPEQQQAVRDVIAQVQKQMTAMANKAAGDAQKAASDLKKSLPLK